MNSLGESAWQKRIACQCGRPALRRLYQRDADGLHYWLNEHCGRFLMVSFLGQAVDVTAEQLATEWRLRETFIEFPEASVSKLHRSEYDKPLDSQERFRKGVRGVFKFGKKARMCKFCRAKNLRWQDTERGFRLFEPTGEEHVCAGNCELY